jgi:O-antigen/teichoic acid export membrane protein
MISFVKGHLRSSNYFKQVGASFFFKSGSIFATFLIFPITLNYLGQEVFGIWSTMLSLVLWISFCDIGIANSLRNKIAEHLAKNQIFDVHSYISSGQTLISIIALTLWVLFTIIAMIAPWQSIFNTQSISETDLMWGVLTLLLFLCINFWLGTVASVLGAMQQSSLISFGQLVTNLMTLAAVYILAKTFEPDLMYLCLAYGICLVAGNCLLIYVIKKKYQFSWPKFKIKKIHISELSRPGINFFIIQLAALVIFTSDKVLISQLLGPQFVAEFDAVFKLFGIVTLLQGLILMPLWSAYTDAYHRQDREWLKRTVKQQLYFFFAVVFFTILLAVSTKSIIGLWLGPTFEVSGSLITWMAIFVLISSWNNVYAVFVNGIGKIRPQCYSAVVGMIVNIPLAYLFVSKFDLGISGILMASTISLMFSGIVLPFQVRSIIKRL